jgi:dipeptidyl aminopeptidase/acylaminoacyl peptidase
MKHRLSLPIMACVLCTCLLNGSLAQAKRPLEIADLFRIVRISDPALSPDGMWIVYTRSTPDLTANKIRTTLYLIPSTGGQPRALSQEATSDRTAAWAPDSRRIAYVSSRSGSAQVWVMNIETGETSQFTRISTEAAQPLWSPDGSLIAFVSEVLPEYSDQPFDQSDRLNAARLDAINNGVVKAKVFTQLLFREWDAWRDGRRKHIFVQPVGGGQPRDLTPGNRDAIPFSSTFSSGAEYSFSPDSREIAYTATPLPTREEAWSTNHDIYTIPVTGGTPKQITTNPAADGCPKFSPDGKYLAYRAQSVPNFEADRWQLMLYERTTGKTRSLTENFDARVASLVWSPDSKKLYFECEDKGEVPVFCVSIAGNDVARVVSGATNHDIRISPDGKYLYVTRCSLTRPTELFKSGTDGRNFAPVTTLNDSLFATIDIPEPESIWFEGEGGRKIQAWLFKPPAFDKKQKYPFVYMIHGGPQNAWLNTWGYRWLQPLWAAQGYVVMAPNPRGSTGFGQQFTNEISRDWGGKVFVDLLKGLDYAQTLSYVDTTRKAAAGASFGGYMMNWFQGHCDGRFRTLVTHDGVYNFESMYGTTEEIWFDEWDHGGTPWDKQGEFRTYSPHVYAKNFRTPNLIIHSERDYRVPIGEGLQLFTALQRQGIPSKFLYFPDEGHTIMKPANSELWHRTVFDWLAEYLKR